VQTAHGTTQPLDRPTIEYPTCATISGPLHQVSYSCHDPHRCTPCHVSPAHHKTSKRDSPNETKIKEKQNKTIPDSNSNIVKSMTHHNQIMEWITWFLIQQPNLVNSLHKPILLGIKKGKKAH
jgi:hypothetical protein